jgi:hypothetical protein
VDADGKGYFPQGDNGNGPGAGQDANGGGGHGGAGGGGNGGETNGIAALPISPGSPGGWRGRGGFTVSGKGGGAIHIRSLKNVTVEGTLTANGFPGTYYAGPGGSGGSIFLAGTGLSGSGMLRAEGGAANQTDGHGGGGRIAVWYGPAPEELDWRIAETNLGDLAYSQTLGTFTGTLSVTNGGGTTAQNGTGGFYYVPPPVGTALTVW